jgi:hypothetical protein
LNYAHRWQLGSLWFNSDTRPPEAADIERQMARLHVYVANRTPWELFHLLHDLRSSLEFFTDGILDEVKSNLIANGIYHDSSKALQQAVTDAGAAEELQGIDLRKLVHDMHDKGTETCLQKNLDIRKTIDEGKRSVEHYLVQHHVPQNKAKRVAEEWYKQVFTHYWHVVTH